MELLNALSVELNDILTINELNLQKSADLYAQIAACEARQEYVKAALVEGEKIAEEITSNAAQRVRDIITRALNIIEPQREQIACFEQEIAALNREIIEQSKIIEIDKHESLMHLDTFVDAHHYENIDTSNEQLYCLCENQTLIKQVQTRNSEFDSLLPGEDKLQALREALSARELPKPDLSFKEKLGKIFKARS